MMGRVESLAGILRWCVAGPLLPAMVCAGCEGRKPPPEPRRQQRGPRDPVVADTVGDVTLLEGGGPAAVRGFGVVIGLGDQGSSDCPTALREYLVEYLNKEFLEPVPGRPKPSYTAGKLLDSLDTAVVQLDARVPPGARKGTRFDVQVSVVTGTTAQSLEGGLLMLSELRLYDPQAVGRGLLAGRVVGRVNGPVFTNPFAEESDSGAADVRRGVILGGGVATEARPVRLLLSEPSYPVARRIENRINEIFGQAPKTAEAMSQGVVLLNTPSAYEERPYRFIQLATHLYVRNEPAYLDVRLGQVTERLPQANLEQTALVWEAIGAAALPRIQPLYSHSDEVIRFHAARAGLRLNDATALPALQGIALQDGNPYQVAAMRELADCELLQAVDRLLPLLDADNVEVRIAAYEALRRHYHPAVRSVRIPHAIDHHQTGLVLDVVSARTRPMIYVRRSMEPRLAVFGGDARISTPLFYAHPRDRVLLSAEEGDEELTITYRLPSARSVSAPVRVRPRVEDLVVRLAASPAPLDRGDPVGAGLSYAQVVAVLHALCRDGTIDAHLELERVSITDLLGPQPAGERREADDDPLLPDGSQQPAPEPPQ